MNRGNPPGVRVPPNPLRSRAGAWGIAPILLLALAACLTSAPSPRGTYAERLDLFARLLAMQDARLLDAGLAGRAAASPDPWLRAQAALAAGRVKDPAARPTLTALLHDREGAVRRTAAFAAGISGDAALVAPLAAALADADAETASLAADALGRLGGEEATRALVTAAEGSTPVRAAAARALFRTGDAKVVERLFPRYDTNDAAFRRAVVYALARKPLPAALPVLRRGLTDPDPRVAALSARAVGVLADWASVPALAALASSADSSAAIQSLGALRALGRKESLPEGACAGARARVADANAGVATTALGALSGCADPESDALLRHALRAGGPRGEEALGALVSHAPDAAALAESAAVAPSLELRLGAADSVGRLPREAARRVAAALLRDGAARVRAAAVSALPDDAPRELLAAALRDRDAAVREAALEKGAPRHGEVAADWDAAYAAAFREAEPDFTVGALEAAAALPEKRGEPLLRAKADGRDHVVRSTARRLLAAKFGARPSAFVRMPVKGRYDAAGWERIARQANESLLTATVETARGSFEVALDAEAAPVTVDTFRELAGQRYFDGTLIHRVVPDFVIQAGDPRGDGSGGPGFAIRDELNPLPYVRGAVGMALSGPDTGGSQWFVTLSPQPHLEGAYTVFGKVSAGEQVLDRIEKDDRVVSFRVRASRREPPPGFE